MREYYWVNANRGFALDFLFPEFETFADLECGIMMLTAMGYEINAINLIVEEER